MSYASTTRDTKDPLKRIAHSVRLKQAAEMVPLNRSMRVLDYGCGDGGFFDYLEKSVPAENLYGFDPSANLLSEMTFRGATTYQNINDLLDQHPHVFDVVYCMEVCEHLMLAEIFVLFENIRKLAKPDAQIVFGVPIETGPSGFVKNIYRTVMGHQGATFGRAIKSLFGMWIPRASAPRGWIGSHIGFDCKAFSELFKYGGFEIVRRSHLPYPILGGVLNNEAYYVCKIVEKR
jgi:SAM-dependent methyltransferase